MQKKRILIVDDERNVRMSIHLVLEHLDYEIDFAENGVEAIARIEKGPYDLIITDYKMPEMDGVELIQKAKELFPSMPILMVAGDRPEGSLLKCGATAYIEKPFNVFELQKTVERILENENGIIR
ncbi:MAG: response regulator [Deltaproteobacteria bacterium]|nr:response regulator [Deltaproteobacteria bacterium]